MTLLIDATTSADNLAQLYPISAGTHPRKIDQSRASISLEFSVSAIVVNFGGNRRGMRRTGNLRAVQLLLARTKIEGTLRYLGIGVDDAIEIAEKIDI